jgi:hypothetical protein
MGDQGMSHLEVRKTPDGKIQARRLDRKPLTEEDWELAKAMANPPPIQLQLSLVVTRTGPVPAGPIKANPWTIILSPERFVDATLDDLASYVAARNAGSSGHWVEDLLDEKIEQLRLCGVNVEIREVQ